MGSAVTAFMCRGCGRPEPDLVLDLGLVPASDIFPAVDDPSPDGRWPLTLVMCSRCRLVQIGASDAILPAPPTAVESATSLAHAVISARSVIDDEAQTSGETFIEVDSHHGGSWQEEFTRLGLRQRSPDSRADLVIDVHALAHEPELSGPLQRHASRLEPGGRLVLEFHHLLPLVQQAQIDTIRHGHWVYLSALAMQSLLADVGLVLTRAVSTPVFGGSLRLTAQRAVDAPQVDGSVAEVLGAETAAGLADPLALQDLARRGLESAGALRDHLRESRQAGRTVAGYGAPSKAPVLLTLAGVDAEDLPYTVDLSPTKHGCRLPGSGIPILPVETLLRDRPDEVIILTWDIAKEVVGQLSEAASGSGWRPTLVVPLPRMRRLTLDDAQEQGRPRA